MPLSRLRAHVHLIGILSIVCAQDAGLGVVEASPYSALHGSLAPGDTITAIGSCKTPNLLAWKACQQELKVPVPMAATF